MNEESYEYEQILIGTMLDTIHRSRETAEKIIDNLLYPENLYEELVISEHANMLISVMAGLAMRFDEMRRSLEFARNDAAQEAWARNSAYLPF